MELAAVVALEASPRNDREIENTVTNSNNSKPLQSRESTTNGAEQTSVENSISTRLSPTQATWSQPTPTQSMGTQLTLSTQSAVSTPTQSTIAGEFGHRTSNTATS